MGHPLRTAEERTAKTRSSGPDGAGGLDGKDGHARSGKTCTTTKASSRPRTRSDGESMARGRRRPARKTSRSSNDI